MLSTSNKQELESIDPDYALLLKILSVEIDSSLKDLLKAKFDAGIQDDDTTGETCLFPSAHSTKGRLVSESFDKDPTVSAYTLLSFCNIPFKIECHQAFEGLLNARLYSKGITKTVAPEKEDLRRMKNEIKDLLRETSASKDTALRTSNQIYEIKKSLESSAHSVISKISDTSSAQVDGALNAYRKRINETLEEQTQDWKSRLDQSTSELEQLREHYKSSIALEAPVSFWEQKRTSHQTEAAKLLRWIIIGGPIIIGGLFAVGWRVLANYETHHWGRTTLFLFLTVTVIWLLRIVLRLYLSHKHLEVDSQERIVLAKTYISLLADGKGPSEDHRKFVFQALFRPSTTGIIRSEEHPNPMIELVSKAAGNK